MKRQKDRALFLAPNNQLLLCLLNISVVLDANETFWSTFFGFLSNYIFQDGLIWFIKGLNSTIRFSYRHILIITLNIGRR